ncbi:MAG: hypothetical protein AB8B59_11270 [Maribacter sp.]
MRILLCSFLLISCFCSWAQDSNDSLLYLKKNLSIYSDKAFYKKKTLYSSQTDYEEFVAREATPDSDCTVFYESYYNPLSLVGDFYSYEYGAAEEAACGPMGNSLGVRTIAVDTGLEVSMLELFEEEALIAAFKNDSWVLEYVDFSKQDLNTNKSFADILTFFKLGQGTRFSSDSFCILDFENGKAKVRFVGAEYMGYNHNRHLQLGFELPVKKEALKLFADSDNFYLGRFKNGLKL